MIFLLPIFLVISFLISFAITPFVISFARKYGFVDDPTKRPHPAHTHKGVIPRAGGIAIFLGIFIPIFFVLPQNKIFWGIFAAAALIIVTGLWDDKKDRSPYIRFGLNILSALIAVLSGIGIPYITNPLGGIIRLDTIRFTFSFFGDHSILLFADLFALIWIVWCMNMVNWSKGVDGQMPGFVAISSLVIGLLSLRFIDQDIGQISVTYLAFLTAGSFLGFLPWNFYPQKIMPGSGGGALAGFMLAVLSIFSYGKLGTMILVLGIPLADAVYTMGRRIFSGKSPFKPDREHLHHKLLSLGWGRRRIALFYWTISAVLGIIALNLSSGQKAFAMVLVLMLIVGFILWVSRISRLSYGTDEEI